jgi:TonB family protein
MEPTVSAPVVAKASAASVGANSNSVRNFDAVFATPSTPEKSAKTKDDLKSIPAKLSAEEPKDAGTSVLSIVDPLAEEDVLDPVKDHGVPSFGAVGTQSFAGMESQKKRGGKGVWIAALLLGVLAAGGYGAWLTQPGFRKLIEWEYLNVMTKIGAVKAQPQTTPSAKLPTPVSAPMAASAPASIADGKTGDASATGIANQTVATNVTSAPSSTPLSTPSAEGSSAPADTATKTAAALQTAKQDTTPNHSNPSLIATSASVPPAAASKTPSSDLLEVPEEFADDQVLHRVHPTYPKQARARKLHGAVVLQAVINKQGKVDSLQLVSGDPLLAQAAADAVKQWRYKPYWHNGEAADFQTRITVDFKQP